ncbi:uncharacterized protein isoform X1 [Rhodnius prolixus]|uniref:uncharacterized protein isoform X1 n=2 Tax=Rhodnius prolixus TaxID=13249 RepID=UPI003D18ED45
MGSRSRSKLPVRDPRSSKSPTHQKKNFHARVQKDLNSVGQSKTENQNPNVHRLKDPLTPLHRLRRFKKIRDRNIGKGNKSVKRKMSVDVENEDTQENKKIKEDVKNINNGVKEKIEKMTNGESQSEENVGNNKVDQDEAVEKIGDVNGENDINTQKQVITEKVEIERKEIEISLTNDINEIVSDAVIQECIGDKESAAKDEEEEKDTVRSEINDARKEEPTESPVRVLRRSIRGKADVNVVEAASSKSQPSASKRSDSQETTQRKTKRGESRDSTPTAVAISTETVRLIKSPSEGRRSLWQQRSSAYKKRKYDDFTNDGCSQKKKLALSQSKALSSPSILSPGWQFIKSPFTRFWSPRDTPPPGHTPYKTPFPATPYSRNTNIEDSMAVNFDDKSLYGHLNDLELEETNTVAGISLQSSSPTAPNSNWSCTIM